MSQVEKDRKSLKEYQMSKQNKFSYIDTFLKYKCKTQESSVIKKKVGSLSTINILFSVHEGFKKINKDFYKKLESIRKILAGREDLASSLIELIERIDVVYDDLYSWYPGMKYSDPWSYFVELVPNIIHEYKSYYTRTLLLRDKPKEKILEVLRNRMSKSLADFDVINKDMFLFNLDQEESEVKRVKKDGEIFTNIVSRNYWSDEDVSIDESTLMRLGISKKKVKYNEDIHLELNNSLSIIEVEINCKVFRLSLVEFNDLLTQNNRSKKVLMNLKIIDDYWNVI